MDAPVRVYASGDAVAADLMRARLEAEGIGVFAKGEGTGPYRTGPVYLFVAPEDEARATALVDAVESGAYALEDPDEIEGTDEVASPGEPSQG
jgi:hypothetical protein